MVVLLGMASIQFFCSYLEKTGAGGSCKTPLKKHAPDRNLAEICPEATR
jgi:hypothetical protein